MRKFRYLFIILFFSNCILTYISDDLKNFGNNNKSKNILPLLALGGVSLNFSSQNSTVLSADIGEEGGTLKSEDGGISLAIPRGALTEIVKITITKNVTPIGSIPEEYQTASGVLKFEPEGLQFFAPAQLTLRYDQGNMEEGQLEENFVKFAYIRNDGSIEETTQISKDKTNNYVLVEIPHFSYGTILMSRITAVNGGNSDITFVTSVANSLILELKKFRNSGYQNAGQYFRSQVKLLGPFLLRLVDVLGTDPVSAAFPYEDFDGDGIRNLEDPYALAPVNVVLATFDTMYVSGRGSDTVAIKWSSREKSSDYSIRLNADSCENGTVIDSGKVEWNPLPKGNPRSAEEYNTKTFIIRNDLLNVGINGIRICVLKDEIYGFAATTIIKDIVKPVLSVTPEGGTYGKIQSITVNCGDEGGSECSRIIYTTDGSTPRFSNPEFGISQIGRAYNNPITTPAGTITQYNFLAKDAAGNTSLLKTEEYNIDSIAPTIRINSVQPSTLISIGTTPSIDWQANRDGAYEIKIGTDCISGTLAFGSNVAGSLAKDTSIRTEINPTSQFVLGENKLQFCFTNTVGNFGTTTKTFTLVSFTGYENVSYEYWQPAHYTYFVPVIDTHFILFESAYPFITSFGPWELYNYLSGNWVQNGVFVTEHSNDTYGSGTYYPYSQNNYWGRQLVPDQWSFSGNIGNINLAQWELYRQDVLTGTKRYLSGTPR